MARICGAWKWTVFRGCIEDAAERPDGGQQKVEGIASVMSKGIAAALDKIDRDNRQASEVILADLERYAGIQVMWARAWMRNHGTKPEKKTENNP